MNYELGETKVDYLYKTVYYLSYIANLPLSHPIYNICITDIRRGTKGGLPIYRTIDNSMYSKYILLIRRVLFWGQYKEKGTRYFGGLEKFKNFKTINLGK